MMSKLTFLTLFHVACFVILSFIAIGLTLKTTAVQVNFPANSISPLEYNEIYKGETVHGQISPNIEGFGSLAIRFNTFHRINNDALVFRIKEVNSSTWYYQHEYKTDQFQPDGFFPFGFPPIKNSSDKKYYFEVESLAGKLGSAVAVSTISPQLVGTYIIQRNHMLTNPRLFLSLFMITLHNMFFSLSTVLILVSLYVFALLSSGVFIKVRGLMQRKKQGFAKTMLTTLKNNPIYFVLLVGLFLRLVLAVGPYNLDVVNFSKDANLFLSGKWNVYFYQPAYNYSPIMYYIIGLLGIIPHIFPLLSFSFIFRLFISGIDVAIFFVIIEIAKERNFSPLKAGILFFLNPVSILLSGHHGQFDNITMLFILLAILAHYKIKEGKKKMLLEWISLTLSIVVKHILIFIPFTFWQYEKKSLRETFLFFFTSIAVFLATFIPFLSAKQQIISHVFQYAGLQGFYGLSYYMNFWCNTCHLYSLDSMSTYKYIFIFAIILFSLTLKTKDIVKNIFLVILFFFTFTSGIGVQYFMIPIALGVFFPSKWFYLYSSIVSLAIIGGLEQQFPFIVPGLSVISWNDVWIFASLWFVSELLSVSYPLRKVYDRYITK